MRKAIGYAGEAVRLLCTHPSLALVALAMGVLTTLDARVGSYLTSQHTAYGRAMSTWSSARLDRHRDDERVRPIAGRAARVVKRTSWAWVTGWRLPQFDAGGSVGLLLALSYGRAERGATGLPPYRPYDAPVRFLLPWLIRALTTSGFLWVAWQAIRRHRAPWDEFLTPGWRVWLRLGVFTSAIGAILQAGYGLAIIGPGWEVMGAVLAYVWAVASFVFLLTPFAIVAGRTGVLHGLRVSAQTVARNLVTALVIVLAPGIVAWPVSLLSRFSPTGQVVARALQSGEWIALSRSVAGSLGGLPLDAALSGITCVIAAWYSAAMLIWYYDLTRTATPEETPALV